MEEKYLIINAGSSSLKFSLYNMPSETEIVNGYIEKIGYDDSFWTIKFKDNKITDKKLIKNHSDAVELMIEELIKNKFINSLDDIKGVGHRVLHGGEYYSNSVLIDSTVLDRIEELTKLGPLHHPGEIAGIKAMTKYMPKVKQIAVFDTAFHQTMPRENYIYAVPYEWYLENGVRRYGFHGTSHKYITEEMKKKLKRNDINLIICHVGSGASICCVKNGKSFDTSMGLTPLDGLIMGTRSGEIDPSIIKYVMKERNLSIEEFDNILNKQSGLLGICGKNDFRDVVKLICENNEQARLAYTMFMDSIIKHIAEYYFELEGNIDALIFTAGVLEHNANIRKDIINKLSGSMNVYLDNEANNNPQVNDGLITLDKSNIPVYVIPTNEEIMIVRDVYKIVNEEIL